MIKLKKIIKEEYNNYINEYITKDEISLLKYLNAPYDERIKILSETYPEYFYIFIKDENYEDQYPDVNDDNSFEKLESIKENNPEIFYEYGEWLYKEFNRGESYSLLPLSQSEYPAWTYFIDGEILKNQWLVHFSEFAEDIAKEGFKYGLDDITRLGLTTQIDEFEKQFGGYNFAYSVPDFYKYSKSFGQYKYGGEVVVFRASGVRTYHSGDEEYQTIFFGNTAKNIVPILEDDSTNLWTVYSSIDYKKNILNPLYKNENLEKVVDWVVNNYDQYRKHLDY